MTIKSNPKPYPKPKEIWQHYKGGQYEIVAMCNHTDTDEVLVIYRSLSFGGFHARPYSEWHEVVPNTDNNYKTYRFTLAPLSNWSILISMIKLVNLIREAVNVPPVLYHATYKPLLSKIKQNGLDTTKSKKAWEDSKPGLVYLATDIDVAGSYAEASDMVPDSYLDNIIVLHIDTSKLDLSKLTIDRNVQDNVGDTLEYNGVIPFSAVNKVTNY